MAIGPLEFLNSPLLNTTWEQRKFSETLSFLRNNTLSRADLSDAEGQTRNVHYGDILIRYGEVLDASRDSLPRIADDAAANGLSCQPLIDGDVIFADTAEDEAVGKCSELRGCRDRRVVSGLHTMACRPLFEFAPGYLGYYFNSASYHNQLLPLMQGIKVISVSKSAIEDTDMQFPAFEEQKTIGEFFLGLDSLITLHQREGISAHKEAFVLMHQRNKFVRDVILLRLLLPGTIHTVKSMVLFVHPLRPAILASTEHKDGSSARTRELVIVLEHDDFVRIAENLLTLLIHTGIFRYRMGKVNLGTN